MTMFQMTSNESTTQRGGSETIRITGIAHTTATEVLQRVKNKEWTEEQMTEVTQDHDKMDNFLQENNLIALEQFVELEGLDDGLVERMIKSQQSKRSRAKSKQLTEATFIAMLEGAVCENVLRTMYDKEKGQMAAPSRLTELTDEDYQKIAEDQEELRRMIRNVQSRKSIAKSKRDFTEDSEMWQQLLIVEEKLKSLRTGSTSTAALLPVKNILVDVDIDGLKASEAKALLAQIKELVAV